MICGLEGRYRAKLRHIRDIIGLAPGVREFAAMSLMITSRGIVFLADTHVQADPTAEAIADTVVMCARTCRALRHRAQDRARCAFRLRRFRHAVVAQDAPGAGSWCTSARPASRSTARCRRIRR